MKLSIVLTTLFATFATGTPDLCDDVYRDPTGAPYVDSIGQMLARFCEWTGPDAPIWDADVCCSFAGNSASCSVTDSYGRCPSGKKKAYCEHGEADSAGAVTCYQPFPDACELGFCLQAPELPPDSQEGMACCVPGGVCQSASPDDLDHCIGVGGIWIFCANGVENADGTLDCWD